MSHNNLMALYCYIADQKQAFESAMSAPTADTDQKEFARGGLEVLEEFETFLHDSLDQKLPRRIYRQLKSQSNSCDILYAIGK